MGAPRQGLNPTTNSVGFTAKLVTVRSVSADGTTAVVVDRQNTQTSVSMLVQRSKGPLPAPGDTWLIAQDLGMWTFAAFVGASGSDFAEGGPAAGQVNVSDEEPAPGGEDDLWLNPANGNQVSVWSGGAWVPAQFGAAALAPASITAEQMALATITSRQIAADAGILASQVSFTASQIGGSRVFTGTAQPSGMVPGDLWFNAGNGNSVAVWTGEGWDSLLFSAPAIAPSSLTGAQLSDEASIAATQVDFTASDIGGVTVSITAEEPPAPAVGDLWYDSTHGYVLRQWDGSEWAIFQYGTQAIAARAVTAELIAANTITAAELAAGIVYAGIIDGTFINAATFIGSIFQGTDFILSTAGAFWYSGAPALGNLILSVAPASTTADGFGNSVSGGGFAAYSATPGIVTTMGPTGLGFVNIPSGILTVFEMAPSGLRVSGFGVGQSTLEVDTPITPGLPLLAQSSAPPTSGFGQLYANASGTPSGETPAGLAGSMPLTQVDASVVGPVTAATPTALSKVWPIPAFDAQANTAYRLTVGISGRTGTTQETLSFQISAFGAALASFTIGGLQFPVSTDFEGTLICTVACVSSTSARASITGNVSISTVATNLLTSSNSANATIPVGGFSGATAITTSVNSNMTLQAAWGSAAVSCTVSSGFSILERLGQ